MIFQLGCRFFLRALEVPNQVSKPVSAVFVGHLVILQAFAHALRTRKRLSENQEGRDLFSGGMPDQAYMTTSRSLT